MPLTAQDYLVHPEYGPMPQEMMVVAQQCCGLSKAACSGDRGVVDSNLTTERRVTDAELSADAVARDPTGGSFT